jgi:membrane-associated phospholipid phosphatase
MLFTHLQTPSDAITADFPWIFQNLNFQNDLFFSGHTAIPFLGFFLFRRSPLRYVFLVGSLVMAFVVLAMHLHYSIDVFSAFFITYCSYRIGCFFTHKIDATFHE